MEKLVQQLYVSLGGRALVPQKGLPSKVGFATCTAQ
jgi:hypothetical protein